MAPKTKTKTKDLVDRANELLRRPERDEFTITKLRREANNLTAVEPVAAFVVFGILASLEWEVGVAKKNFDKALTLSPGDFRVSYNYSAALHILGFYSDARRFAEKAFQARSEEPKILEFLIERLVQAGRFQDAQLKMKILKKMVPEKTRFSEPDFEIAGNFLQQNGVNDDDVEKLFELSTSVLRKKKIPIRDWDFAVMEDEHSEWLGVFFEIDQPVKEIVELDYQAARNLARADDLDATGEFVIVSFTSSIPRGS